MDNKLQFKGTIVKVDELNIVSEKFRKQNVIVKCHYQVTNGTITHYFVLTALNMLTDVTNNFKEGDEVEGDFRVKGNRFSIDEGKYKYMNHLDIMSIKKISDEKI